MHCTPSGVGNKNGLLYLYYILLDFYAATIWWLSPLWAFVPLWDGLGLKRDRASITLCVLLHLSKTFISINHSIFLGKLPKLGYESIQYTGSALLSTADSRTGCKGFSPVGYFRDLIFSTILTCISINWEEWLSRDTVRRNYCSALWKLCNRIPWDLILSPTPTSCS